MAAICLNKVLVFGYTGRLVFSKALNTQLTLLSQSNEQVSHIRVMNRTRKCLWLSMCQINITDMGCVCIVLHVQILQTANFNF